MARRSSDSTLEAVRRVRREISEEIEHDPKRLLEYYRKLESQYADRLVHLDEWRER